MGEPGLLVNVPSSRREHAIHNTLTVEFSDSLLGFFATIGG